MLQRLRAAPWLGIDVSDLDSNWAYGQPEPGAQVVDRLQKNVEVAIALCRGLDLRLLVSWFLIRIDPPAHHSLNSLSRSLRQLDVMEVQVLYKVQ